MTLALDRPTTGSVVTFSTWDFRLGRPRFIGIGVVAGEPEPHPALGLLRLPLRPLDGADWPVPEWIALADVIDVVPPGS